MNENELNGFEKELRKLKTARPPAEFLARMTALKLAIPVESEHRTQPVQRTLPIGVWFRWLAPAAIVFAVAATASRWAYQSEKTNQPVLVSAPDKFGDEGVELDRQLVAEFDAVAQMPGGEPVRFRCREWTDQVVVRDSANGFVLERSLPRFEIVPVRLETY